MLVFLYLAAIVAANLSSAQFGPTASVFNAFVFIGLDLTTRDRLHEKWQDNRALKMLALIVVGGALSYALNAGAGPIALASCAAFALAALADYVVYSSLSGRSRMTRVNGSNVVSAAVDSLIFPTLAFGGFLPLVTLGQFLAKVVGGWLWSLILFRRAQLAEATA
jgi:uncharacterized PurR-regulated membrane protein YhhQ (DUF165 family)